MLKRTNAALSWDGTVIVALSTILLLLLQPSPNAAFNTSPVSLQEELGCSPTLSKILQLRQDEAYYFDPLGLATDDNFSRLREAELKHGRVAMITFVWSWIAFVPTIIGERTDIDIDANSDSDSDIITEDGLISTGRLVLDVLGQKQLPPLFELWQRWSPTEITKFVLICGILETIVLVQVKAQDMPGDYGLAYFGVRDKGLHEKSLVSELENGRLAMLVMLYYAIHEITTRGGGEDDGSSSSSSLFSFFVEGLWKGFSS